MSVAFDVMVMGAFLWFLTLFVIGIIAGIFNSNEGENEHNHHRHLTSTAASLDPVVLNISVYYV